MNLEVRDLLKEISKLGKLLPKEGDCWGYKDPPPAPFIKINQNSLFDVEIQGRINDNELSGMGVA